MGVYREEKIKLFENNTGCPADISLKMVILTSPHGAACLCVEYLLPLLTIYQNSPLYIRKENKKSANVRPQTAVLCAL